MAQATTLAGMIQRPSRQPGHDPKAAAARPEYIAAAHARVGGYPRRSHRCCGSSRTFCHAPLWAAVGRGGPMWPRWSGRRSSCHMAGCGERRLQGDHHAG
ncbi:MAG: hypothetical protein IPM70_18720 [Proteobacteria bacterium]|nr:hypothetical protein [Pseudomonadota bacterium]